MHKEGIENRELKSKSLIKFRGRHIFKKGKFKSTKRKDPVKCYMEINDLENHFVSIVIYYGNHKYSTIFRTVKL